MNGVLRGDLHQSVKELMNRIGSMMKTDIPNAGLEKSRFLGRLGQS